MVARLTPGTEVLTVGGLHATVVSLGGDRVRVRVADGSEMEFAPRAISAVTKRSDDEDLEADAEEADAEDALAEDAQASEPDAPALDGGFATSSSDEGKDDARMPEAPQTSTPSETSSGSSRWTSSSVTPSCSRTCRWATTISALSATPSTACGTPTLRRT